MEKTERAAILAGLRLDAEKDDDLDLANAAQDASIIRFVNQILTEAIESRATDEELTAIVRHHHEHLGR